MSDATQAEKHRVMAMTGERPSGWILVPPTKDNAGGWGGGGYKIGLHVRLGLPIKQLQRRGLRGRNCDKRLDLSTASRAAATEWLPSDTTSFVTF